MVRPFAPRLGFAALFALVPCAPAAAQVYVVDPAGGGDFTDLQVALDSVPDGAALRVRGHWHDAPIVIRKSVAIAGLQLETAFGPSIPSVNAAISIDAGPDATVTLADVAIELGAAIELDGTDGIVVHSAGDVVLSNVTIVCNGVMLGADEFYGRNGIGVSVDHARSLLIDGCDITGGGGYGFVRLSYCDPNPRPPDGGAAVSIGLLDEPLRVSDSRLEGGAGSGVDYWCGEGCEWDAIVPGGDGGAALDHSGGLTITSNVKLLGGAPGRARTWDCRPPLSLDGKPGGTLHGTRRKLTELIDVDQGRIGQSVTVSGHRFAPRTLVWVWVSESLLTTPIELDLGPWFLAPPASLGMTTTTDATGFFWRMPDLPDDPAIVGLPFFVQATDFVRLSEPELVLPRPHG